LVISIEKYDFKILWPDSLALNDRQELNTTLPRIYIDKESGVSVSGYRSPRKVKELTEKWNWKVIDHEIPTVREQGHG
jgi:hypothetical protein